MIFKLFLFLFLFTFSFPPDLWAWGPGVHLLHGNIILSQLDLFGAWIAALLADYRWDYLYGCLSADIFIGKGHKPRDDHCHNWSVAWKMLKRIRGRSCQAFTLGYLSHLAADIIAHNFYIPNQLYLTPLSKRVGHLYWELVIDRFIGQQYWALTERVLRNYNRDNDQILQELVPDRLIPFEAKRKIFLRMIRLYEQVHGQRINLGQRQTRGGRLSTSYVDHLLNLSIALVKDLLREQENSVCLKYDPVGSINLEMAKKMRRWAKRGGRLNPDEEIFLIPQEIQDLLSIYQDA